ncbi:MAG: phospholipase [Chitinophagia bacterium]|nr:phospholipase [Chitinophagia bacterium]
MSSRGRRRAGYSRHNRVRLVRGGRDYFAVFEELIRGAQTSVHLQTYIFEEDHTGLRMAALMREVAEGGVKVYVMVDGYASRGLSTAFREGLEASGIHFRYFEPLFRSDSLYIGRRLHHKILVVDASRALVGGLNISDRYNDMPGQPAWLDWAVLTEGEAAYDLFLVCTLRWAKRAATAAHMLREHPIPIPDASLDCPVRVRQNDWVNRKIQVTRSYAEMLRTARSEVVIMSSYFLPGRGMLRALRRARARGVRIRLVLAGMSDVALSKAAERYLYRWIFRNGIEVFEYRPNVLHGKIAVRDCAWVTVGSYNVNLLSAFASVELNLDVDQSDFGRQVASELERIMRNDCSAVTEQDYRTRYHLPHRIFQWLSYECIRLVFFLFTFRFRQR